MARRAKAAQRGASKQANLQNLPKELKEHIFSYISSDQSKSTYSLGKPSEHQLHLHRLGQVCRSWRAVTLPKLWRRLEIPQTPKCPLSQLRALSEDSQTLSRLSDLRCTIPREPNDENHDVAPSATHIFDHIERDLLLSEIVSRCSELFRFSCNPDTSQHLPSLPTQRTVQNLTVLTRLTRLATDSGYNNAPHILLMAQLVRVLPRIQVLRLFNHDKDAVPTSRISLESARQQLLLAVADANTIKKLSINTAFLPHASPQALGVAWLPHIAQLQLVFTSMGFGTSAAGMEEMLVWLSCVCLGYTRELLVPRRHLPAMRQLLLQNGRDTSITSLDCWTGGSTDEDLFQPEDLEHLCTASLCTLELSGTGCAALAARLIETKGCSALRTIKLGGGVPDTAKLHAIRNWARGRQGMCVTWNKQRLEDTDLRDA